MGTIMAEAAPLPIALAELKAYLRVAVSDEDALLAGLVRGAADMCEAFTGRALVERAVTEMLAAATAWTRLGAAPVRAILAVEALDGDGDTTPLAADSYAVDIDAAGDGWVRLTAGGGDAKRIRVAYRAGLAADPNGLPEALRHGIVRMAAHLYTQRDRDPGSGSGTGAASPPAAVAALWRPWRRLRLR